MMDEKDIVYRLLQAQADCYRASDVEMVRNLCWVEVGKIITMATMAHPELKSEYRKAWNKMIGGE
jgi:hypothetical protein